MDEWTLKCLRCKRDIDLWSKNGHKKVFNLTARLELKCDGEEFQGEDQGSVRKNGTINPRASQLQMQNQKKREANQKIGASHQGSTSFTWEKCPASEKCVADGRNAGCTKSQEIWKHGSHFSKQSAEEPRPKSSPDPDGFGDSAIEVRNKRIST